MKVRVKLFGTLSQGFPAYNHDRGMVVEIPDGASVGDLVAHLGVSKASAGVVAVAGRLLPHDAVLADGCDVNIFQSVFGG